MTVASVNRERQAGFFPQGGAMGELVRAKDWSATPFGPLERWPQSLKTVTALMLESSFAMVVAWGAEFRFLYNDRYRPVLGNKHPFALGAPAKDIFPEVWESLIGPLFQRTRAGETITADDLYIPLHRHGYLESCYFTISYSPIRDESGDVGGMLAVVAETTERVEGERRLVTLRDLARRATDATSPGDACVNAAEILAGNPTDVPFAIMYLLDEAGTSAVRISCTGIEPSHAACPERLTIGGGANGLWPLDEALQTGKAVVVEDVLRRFGEIPSGPYPEPVHTATILPLVRPGTRAYGFLIVGVSARRALNERYRDFFELATEHITTGIANARAFEEERRRANALAEIDRAKTTFFSNVSHEFRTPLTLMLGPLEQAMREDNGSRESLEMAYRNSLRLLKLVNSLLDFSRIEAGRIDASYEPTDLAAYTAELASLFRSAIEKAGVRFRVNCAALSEPVYVDRDMWEKIVFNLLSNALKFTFEGEIEISLTAAGAEHPAAAAETTSRWVELRVRDTGTGIPAAELPRIFDRFHRVRNARSRSHEGTGIGLALVQELAKLHGGTARVESVEGQGATFIISLPFGSSHLPRQRLSAARSLASTSTGALPFVEEALRWIPETEPGDTAGSIKVRPLPDSAPEEPEDLPPPAAPSGDANDADKPLILLADDNGDMRKYFRRILVGSGYEVVAVGDGLAALEATRARKPALVLSDVMMPGMDGFELLRALRENRATRTTPVILVSARAGEEARVEGVEAGADDYLTKPFSARELLARVETHLKLARLRREAATAAERERERLYQVLLRAPAMICVLRGPEHVFELANDHYVELIGRRSAGDILGKTVRQALPELEGQGFYELLDGVFATGVPFVGKEMTVKLQRNTGPLEETIVNFVYQPTRDVEGRIDGILVHAVEITELVRNRQRLEELTRHLQAERDRSLASEQHLRAIVETTPECVKVVAPDGTLLEMNSAGLQMVEAGCAEAVIGRNVYELIAPRDRERFREFNERVCGGLKGTLEFDVIGLNGAHRQMETHAAPLRLPDGRTVQLALTRDVSERKRVERARRESERDFRAFVDASSDAVYRMSGDWSVMRRLDGKALIADTIDASRSWLENYVHPDDQVSVKARIAEAIRTQTTFELEHRIIRADGSIGWTFSRAIPLFDENGAVTEWLGAAIDVTERKAAQEALQRVQAEADRERRLYHTVLASTPDLAYVFDLNHRFIYANEALLAMWGRSADQALGKNCLELGYEPWHAAMHDRDIDRVIASRRPVRSEVPFTSATGRRIYDYIFVPVIGANGEVEAVAGTTRDVTEMVQARETIAQGREELERLVSERTARLQQTIEQMEEFSYSVSHDLRSPVRAMHGYAEALLEDYGERVGNEGRELLNRIRRASGRMDRLIQDLLTYSRISRREMKLETVSLSRLIHEITQQYPELQPERAQIDLAPGLPDVIAHEPSLTQVVTNLLSNAVKFVAAGRRPVVQVGFERRGDVVRVTFDDNGVGIPPEYHHRLFSMFTRLHANQNYDGTGIGLAIVRKAVERMNGKVGMESDGANGSRFWIELAAAAH